MIEARCPNADEPPQCCTGCGGVKGAPIACVVAIWNQAASPGGGVKIVLCEECGRDAANGIGFMCIRDGGWSKLVARRRKGGA